MDILIITKDLDCKGGVANYFRLFFKKYKSRNFEIVHFAIGSRNKNYDKRQNRHLGYFLDLVKDIFCFLWLMIFRSKIKIVQVNPSLIPVALLRDGIFIILARLFKRKTVVFFRGWRDDIADKITNKKIYSWLFKICFGHANAYIVLAEQFKPLLVNWGCEASKIHVSRTMYDEDLIIAEPQVSENIPRLLFLSRVSRQKGTWELIETVSRLKAQGVDFILDIYGHAADQNYYENLLNLTNELGLGKCVQFHSFIDGRQKYLVMAKADIFILPSWEEGCPNSVLEAMASGCFIVCTDVGALAEVVQNGKNGCIVNVNDTDDFAAKLVNVLGNLVKVRQQGMDNKSYATKHFSSKIIVKQLNNIYREIDNDR